MNRQTGGNLALILAILVLLAAGCGASHARDTLVVGFWNVENLFDSLRDDAVPDAEVPPPEFVDQKLTRCAEIIRKLDCDILGLAEVENRGLLRRLVQEKLPGMGYDYYELIEERDTRGIDVALIAKQPFLARSFSIPNFPRGALACRFMVEGQPFYVLVNHWKSRAGRGDGEAQRLGCARRVLDIVQRELPAYEGGPVPVLVCGDLNDEKTDPSVAALTAGGLFDTLGTLATEQRWTAVYHDRQANEVLYQGFDHLLVNRVFRDGRGWEWERSTVPWLPQMLTERTIHGQKYIWPERGSDRRAGYSDHRPVAAFLRFVPPPTPAAAK